MAGNGLRDIQRETAAQGNEHPALLQEAKSGSGARHLTQPCNVAQELHSEVLQEVLCRAFYSLPLQTTVTRQESAKDL
jgi:hypothetical protein